MCFETVWNEKDFVSLLNQALNSAWLVEASKAVCAFVVTMDTGDDVEILTVATSPEFQRQGLAKQLLLEIDGDFNPATEKRWLLEVAEDNYSAIHFYSSLGFSQIGIRKNYYKKFDGTRKNALILTANCGELIA